MPGKFCSLDNACRVKEEIDLVVFENILCPPKKSKFTAIRIALLNV